MHYLYIFFECYQIIQIIILQWNIKTKNLKLSFILYHALDYYYYLYPNKMNKNKIFYFYN